MAHATLASFLEDLDTIHLLDETQAEELHRSIVSDRSPESLANELICRKWLTVYQARQLLQGQGKSLRVGPYCLFDRLGEGGMGQVYKARHQTLKRIVALKVMRPERLSNPAMVKRFYREVQAVAQLVHPHIVTAYDAGQAADIHYCAMEFVEGCDLNQLVKEVGPLSIDLACDFIRQAALGLQRAHERGYVHRDIKPSNLLVSQLTGAERPMIKILDLGLARLREDDGPVHTKLTQLGAILGTPEFMAPEQAHDSSVVDVRADLYSLGCTFYYVLTSQPPFRGETLMNLLLMHRDEPPPRLARFRPEAPAKVQDILDRLLAKRPDERYRTPAELAAVLAPLCPADSSAWIAPPEMRTKLAGLVTTGASEASVTAVNTPGETKPARRKDGRSAVEKKRLQKRRLRRRFVLSGGLILLVAGALAGLAPRFIGSGMEPTGGPEHARRIEKSAPSAPPTTVRPPATEPERILAPRLEPVTKPELIPTPRLEAAAEPKPETDVVPTKAGPMLKPAPAPRQQAELIPAPKLETTAEPKTAPRPGPRKPPVPNAEVVSRLEGLIREEHKASYAGKRAVEMQKLAVKFRAEADENKDHPARRYVLLHEASDLAAQAGHIEHALETLEALESEFAVERISDLKIQALDKASAWGPPAVVIDKARALAEELIEEDRLVDGLRCLTIAEQAVRRLPKIAGAVPIAAQLQSRKKEVEEQRKAYEEREAVSDAREQLQRNPEDPAANAILGKYLCVHKDNWEEGLSLLGKGSDTRLKELARQEAEPGKAPVAMMKLGTSWQLLAQKETAARSPFLKRARSWLEQAVPDLPERDRLRVQNQIREIDKLLPRDELTGKDKEAPEAKPDCEKKIKAARKYFEQGRYREAARSMRVAVEATVDETSRERMVPFLEFAGKMSLAQGAAQRGRFVEAARTFAEASELAPDEDSGKFARYLQLTANGWRALKAGNQADAASAFEAARKVLPSVQMRNVLRCSCQ